MPRVRRGDSLYRVEWNKTEPTLIQYEVLTGTVLSIVVKDPSGKEHILVGKTVLSQFAVSPEKAVVGEFERIARDAVKHRRDALKAFRRVLQLGSLVPANSGKK